MPTPPYPVTANADKTKEYVTVDGKNYDPIPGTKDPVPSDAALLDMALYLVAVGRLNRSWVEDIQSKKATLIEKQNLVGVYEEAVAPLSGIGKLPKLPLNNITNPISGITSGVRSVEDLIQILTTGETWIRVAEFAVGALLLGVGFHALMQSAIHPTGTSNAGRSATNFAKSAAKVVK